MRPEVLSAAARRDMFLSPDALEIVLSSSDPVPFLNNVLDTVSKSSAFVTKADIEAFLSGDKAMSQSFKAVRPPNKRLGDISIVPDSDITGNSTCEGTIDDFVRYFQSRYSILKKIIERHRDFGSAMSIEKALGMDREVRVIGMVGDVKDTKNGHKILAVEDDQGTRCKVLILNTTPAINDVYVNDQVIGIIGRPGNKEPGRKRETIIADQIVWPDVPSNNSWTANDNVSSVAFLSDVHIGSCTFLERTWEKMIKWLKQNSEEQELNYIVLPGDVVDGIGIFPGQEQELSITGIYKQYEALGEHLKEIPDHIKVVVQPGNHDACRLAEPQPALGSVFTGSFDSNVLLAGNPVYMNIEGRTVLTYHGRSIDDWISGVQKLTYENPLAVMKEMLVMRHLSPIYGQRNALAPEKRDYLAIGTVPDIFVTGHVHGAGYSEYRGVKMINASTWQDQTEYQKMHNFNPDPGIMPIVHLGTGRVDMHDFRK